jgi:putative transposase
VTHLDGRPRALDGQRLLIERLWRSLKHEDVYLKGYADGRELHQGLSNWIAFYNNASQHPSVYVIQENRFC